MHPVGGVGAAGEAGRPWRLGGSPCRVGVVPAPSWAEGHGSPRAGRALSQDCLSLESEVLSCRNARSPGRQPWQAAPAQREGLRDLEEATAEASRAAPPALHSVPSWGCHRRFLLLVSSWHVWKRRLFCPFSADIMALRCQHGPCASEFSVFPKLPGRSWDLGPGGAAAHRCPTGTRPPGLFQNLCGALRLLVLFTTGSSFR